MNFALPSGSSPPEKPPGMKIIWLLRTSSANASALLETSSAVRFRTTKIFASAPASSMARALSTSQLVPGKAGISTRGFAVRTAGAGQLFASKRKAFTWSFARTAGQQASASSRSSGVHSGFRVG